MAVVRNLDAAVGANFISDATAGAVGLTFTAANADGVPLKVNRAVAGIATIGLMDFGVSGASVAVLQFSGSAFASVSTIKFITGGVAGTMAIRVTNAGGTVLGWIPVLPDGAVTAIAF